MGTNSTKTHLTLFLLNATFLNIESRHITSRMQTVINKILCGDCIDILPTLPKRSVNTILTDPPFFLPSQHYASRDKRWTKKFSDLSIMRGYFKQVLRECKKILKWDGHILVFCDSISYPLFFGAAYNFFDLTRCLVWYKGKNYFPLGKGAWRRSFELILHSRNSGAYFLKKNRQDVIEYPVVPNKERIHPAEKPIGLLRELLMACTPSNGVVLDPFIGAGSTAIAAKDLELSFIGIELDEDYCKVARKRLASMPQKLSSFC